MLLLLLAALLLSGCGGGSSSVPAVTPAPAPAPRSIDFTFFGQSDTAITAAFTNSYMAVDWGAWAFPAQTIELRQIAEMQQARARGVDRFILAVSFLLFDAQCNYVGNAALAAYKLQLDALGLSPWMLYVYDEPDVHGCSGATMARAMQETANIWPVRLGVIYGPNGATPGIDQATDVGRDNYGHGPQVLDLRPDQHLMLIAGGANPYREDPAPFVQYAQTHANVSVVWAFLAVPYTDPDGHPQLGIADNGMLPAYKAAGCALTLKCAN